MVNYKNYIGLGIAGNFALHLQQAGELEDFKNVITEDENGPKGMFPFYLPNFEGPLGVYPLSSDTIKLPQEVQNVQLEPEVGLVCEIGYEEGKVVSITPTHFGAYNDCSIRKEGAKKISEKKNWGDATKGLSDTLIEIDRFSEGGIMDSYHIASFLRRDGNVFRYGEDAALTGYTYFYEKLTSWIINQLNSQVDFGPLEPISDYLAQCDYPEKAVISIGATRYTEYGEKTYLQSGDELIVVVYDSNIYCTNPIFSKVVSNALDVEGISALVQKVL